MKSDKGRKLQHGIPSYDRFKEYARLNAKPEYKDYAIKQFAAMLDLKPSSFSTTLKRWKKAGIITDDFEVTQAGLDLLAKAGSSYGGVNATESSS